MVIQQEIEIDNSIQKAWKLLGHEFAHPYRWAASVNHSEGSGAPIASSYCDERACQTSMGNIREKLTHYDEHEYSLAYDIIEGLPSFIQSGSNAWSLTEPEPGKVILRVKMVFTFKSWARVLKPLLQPKFEQMLRELVEEFAYYAEQGKPHPRKVKAQAKLATPSWTRLSIFYLLAFVVGTVVPLFFIYGFIQESGGVDLSLFAAQLFENKAAATFSSDLLICSFIFWVFIAYDKSGKAIPNTLYFVILNLTIGLSSALPLYLYFRERADQKKQQRSALASKPADPQLSASL